MPEIITIKRGDIILLNLDPVVGSEQGRTRPALVIQNDRGNKLSPITIIAPITSRIYTKEFPTNIEVSQKDSDLDYRSTILLNQIRAVDKKRILKIISTLSPVLIKKVDSAIKISLGLA